MTSACKKGTEMTMSNDAKGGAIVWLRNVLLASMDAAPLPLWLEKKTRGLIQRAPDWLLEAWADAVNLQLSEAHRSAPDLPEKIRSGVGKEIVSRHFEAHRVTPTARSLRRLVAAVLKLWRAGKLCSNQKGIESGVAALALVNCTAQGKEFAERVSFMLGDSKQTDSLLRSYQLALTYGEEQKLKEIDEVLTRSAYGAWVTGCLEEAEEWLLGLPRFYIQVGQRTPNWDSLWENIFIGGEDG